MGQSASAGERRSAIVAAAMRVLAREGITEATTRKNAAEAGVTLAMNGYCFGRKDELLHAVLLEMMRRTGEIASASLPERHGFAKTLAGAVEAFWRHVEQEPELQVMQNELTLYALRRPESAWLATSQYAGYCAVVADLVQRACDATGEELPRDARCACPLHRRRVGRLDSPGRE